MMMMVQLLRLLLWMLDRRLGSRVTQTPVEFAPRVQRLVRPDPKSGRDAHDQSHEIPGKENKYDVWPSHRNEQFHLLEHKDGKVRT
jgi:hypothetical protein